MIDFTEFKKNDIVAVRWLDSRAFSPWSKEDNLLHISKKEEKVLETPGSIFLGQSDDYIMVSQTKTQDGEMRHHSIKIPKAAIKSIKKVG